MEFQNELERSQVKQSVKALLIYIGQKLKLLLIHLNHQRFMHQFRLVQLQKLAAQILDVMLFLL